MTTNTFDRLLSSFPKPRLCFHCREPFIAASILDIYCSATCAEAWDAKNTQGRSARTAGRERDDRGKWLGKKEARTA